MSERVRIRLMLARMDGDTEPSVVGAVDEIIWENWSETDEKNWERQCKKTWGIKNSTDFKVIWAEFAPDDLVRAFATPTVEGEIA